MTHGPRSVALYLVFALLLVIAPGVDVLARRVAAAPARDGALRLPLTAANADASALELAGQFGGAVRGVAFSDNRLYLGMGQRFTVFDAADPFRPIKVWESAPLGDLVEDVTVAGQYAYVAAGSAGLLTYDLTVPTRPTRTSVLAPSVISSSDAGRIEAVVVSGATGYLLHSASGLAVLNLANAAQPLAGPSTPFSGAGQGVRLAVTGEYVYAVTATGLTIYQGRGVAVNPALVRSQSPGGKFALAGRYAYLGDGNGVHVLDLDRPDSPVEVALFSTRVAGVALAGDRVYVASTISGLEVYDIANPRQTRLLGNVSFDLTDAQLAVAGSTAVYVGTEKHGVRAFDVRDPVRPAHVNFFAAPQQVWAVAVQGNRAYLGHESGIAIVDTGDPANPKLISSSTPRDIPSRKVAFAAGHVYNLTSQGMEVFSVATETQPVLAASYQTARPAEDFVVTDGRAYLRGGTEAGINILDVSVPTNPRLLGGYRPAAGLFDHTAAGKYLYVLAGASPGFRVIDVSNPAQPVETGGLALPEAGRSVAVSGRYAYVAVGNSGLRIIDVETPARPVQMGTYATTGPATLVAVSGTTVYVHDEQRGLLALDVSDPAQPKLLAVRAPAPQYSDLAVQGQHLYLASAVTGLSIFRMGAAPETPTPTPSPGPGLTVAPTPREPAPGSVLRTLGPVTLRWSAPTGAAQYHLRVVPANNDGPGLNLIVGDPAQVAAQSFTVLAPLLGQGPYLLLPGMTYSWQVRTTTKATSAGEDDLAWGPWSATVTFRTPPPSGSGVQPVAPAHGVTLEGAGAATLRWSNSDPAVFYYEIQVSGDTRFDVDPATATSFVWWNLVHGGVASPNNSWRTPALAAGTTYHWRVRPRVQGDGTPVAWSPTWGFRTP